MHAAGRAGLLLLAALAAASCALGQTSAALPDSPTPAPALATTASLHGMVTSIDGSEYEGARVTLELSGSGNQQTLSTETDSTGTFNFANLAPGPYKLTVSAPGFVTQSISGSLAAGENFDAHTIALPMSGATNSVTVSAGSRVEIAQEQINLEEKQRVLGVFPNYYVSYDPDPEPLTAGQKFQLAWKMAIDPITWTLNGVIAGAEQATNTFPGYGQGMQGYGKRFGAVSADTFTSNMIGGAILPSLLRQDPRYIYKGTGSIRSRAWYAIENAVICRGDNRRWQPNYSGILGGLASGAISNLYYPDTNRSDLNVTFTNAAIGIGASALQNLAQEFIVKKLTPRLPKSSRKNTQ
jgi:hypothetical protein